MRRARLVIEALKKSTLSLREWIFQEGEADSDAILGVWVQVGPNRDDLHRSLVY